MGEWPNFFIVGVTKAGTTSLHSYLKEIPGIYMSPVKEPHFFSKETMSARRFITIISDEKKYLSLFDKVKDEKIVGEASATYLADPQAPKLIHQVSPQARILISLRDPVDRIFSNYLMHLQNVVIKRSFHEQLQMELKHSVNKNELSIDIEYGMYSESVKRYLDVFGPQQVKIIIFEEWINNTKDAIEEILRFLDLNNEVTNFKNITHNPFIGVPRPVARRIITSNFVAKIAKKILSESSRKSLKHKLLFKKQLKPKMSEEDRETLIKFYYNDVKKLQTILGRKLPWPNFQN